MTGPKPLPIIFTDPLWRTGGLGGASKLPVALPAGSGQTFSNVETTEQKRNKDFHAKMGNPYFIDFAGVVTPEKAARLGRSMLNYAEYKVGDWVDNIPTNLTANAIKGQLNPTNTTSFLAIGKEALQATLGGTMTRGVATGLTGKAVGSVVASTGVGLAIHPLRLEGSTIDQNRWRFDLYREQMLEQEKKVKAIDEEYAKKIGNKYPSVEVLMETPMWKRDVSPQFTPEERKMQNYEQIIEGRYRQLQAASRERDKLENGFYNDKGELMSAHFIRNSK
jgi:hypothetical protein